MFLRAKRSKHTFSLPRHHPTPMSKNFEDENYFFSFRNGWNVYRNVVCPDVYRHSSTTSHFPFLPHLTLYLLLLVLIKRIFLYLSIHCCCYCYVATHSMNRNNFFFQKLFLLSSCCFGQAAIFAKEPGGKSFVCFWLFIEYSWG